MVKIPISKKRVKTSSPKKLGETSGLNVKHVGDNPFNQESQLSNYSTRKDHAEHLPEIICEIEMTFEEFQNEFRCTCKPQDILDKGTLSKLSVNNDCESHGEGCILPKLTFWHGTSTISYKAFHKEGIKLYVSEREKNGPGFYFSPKPETAWSYARGRVDKTGGEPLIVGIRFFDDFYVKNKNTPMSGEHNKDFIKFNDDYDCVKRLEFVFPAETNLRIWVAYLIKIIDPKISWINYLF